MAKFIALDVKKVFQTDIDISKGIPVDGIISGYAAPSGSGNTELLVQFQFKAEPYRIEVGETLQEIKDAAAAAGYTENGLTIVPVTKINQSEFSPARQTLLNLQKDNLHTLDWLKDANGNVIGTTIQYSKEHEKKPIRIETSDVLIPAPSPYYG
jgi:hypothetical protein